MRQGQQNRRGRNRNRKSQNPLTRSFESNGPDVKIRGTPAHIAEKYVSLARDALSSGDPVLAENYLQHAEHYNRIIMTYREQQTTGDQINGHRGRGYDDDGIDDGSQSADLGADASDTNGHGAYEAGERDAQPRINGNGANGNGHDYERGRRTARDRDATSDEQPRVGGNGQGAAETERPRRTPRTRAAQRQPAADAPDQQVEQPDFLKRPVRRNRRTTRTDEAARADGGEGASADAGTGEDPGGENA